MTALGILLLLVGAALMAAEAHLPTAGVLGTVGAAALVAGGVLAVTGAGAGLAVAAPVAIATGAAGGGFLLVAGRKAAATRGRRISTGPEAIVGHVGVARAWSGSSGQVFVDGALWRARCSWPDEDEAPREGDPVVVERVSGLTLSVRRAEEWEVVP